MTQEEIYEYVWNKISPKISKLIDDCIFVKECLNISNVSEDELKHASDIEYYCFSKGSFNNPLEYDILNEELKQIYSPEEVVKYIKDKYHTYDWQLKVDIQDRGRNVKFIVLLPHNKHIMDMITKDMDKLGYFLGNIVDASIIGYYGLYGYIFHPCNQKNEVETIRQYSCLYHVTPASNLSSILKYGIVKHSSKRLRATFPERVYLVEGRHSYDTMYKVAEMLYKNRIKTDENAEAQYAIIMLDMDEIPENIPMFYDGDYEYGIFVEENIPAKAIFEIRLYDCKTLRYIKYGFWNKLKDKILSIFK